MAIIEDLIENLVERNTVGLNGTFTIALIDGGIRLRGQVFSTLRDQRKNKTLAKADIPVTAEVKVATIVIPLPPIR